MNSINIAEAIAAKRKEKGITQEELASYMGVSRVSVSKWETGQSYPDIVLLPQLAAYFGISIDELIGYEPQMTEDDIRKLNEELLKEFATKSFDDVMNRCRDITKKYFSCFPLLFQIGILLLNYGSISSDDERKNMIIREGKELFIRVKISCQNTELKQLALQSEAVCEMMLGNSHEVIRLLKNERRYSFHPSIGVMLSQSYQKLGEMQDAQITLQDSILDSIISLFYDITPYLAICTNDADHFEEICRRTIDMGKIFNIKELFPVAILPFYLTAAEGYLTIGNTEKALDMLEAYTEIARGDIFPLTVRGDDFFTLIGELQDRQLRTHPFGMQELPRDEQSIKQDMVNAVISNPGFSDLHENQRFQSLAKGLKQVL